MDVALFDADDNAALDAAEGFEVGVCLVEVVDEDVGVAVVLQTVELNLIEGDSGDRSVGVDALAALGGVGDQLRGIPSSLPFSLFWSRSSIKSANASSFPRRNSSPPNEMSASKLDGSAGAFAEECPCEVLLGV